MNSALTKRAQRHHDDARETLIDLLEHEVRKIGHIELEHMIHLVEDGRALLSGMFAFEDDDEKDLAFSIIGTIWGCHPTADTVTVMLDTTLTDDVPEYEGEDAVAIYTTEFESIGDAVVFNRRVSVVHYRVDQGELYTKDITEELDVNGLPSRSMDIIERIFSATRAEEISALNVIPMKGFQRFVQAVGYAMGRLGMVFLPLPHFEIELVQEMVDHYGADQFADARREFEPLRALTPRCMVLDNRPESRSN